MSYTIWAAGRFYTRLSVNRIYLGSRILKRLEEMGTEKIGLSLSYSEISGNPCTYLSGDLYKTGGRPPDTAEKIRDGRLYVEKNLREGMDIENGSELVVIGRPAKDKKMLEIFRREDYDSIFENNLNTISRGLAESGIDTSKLF